MSPVEQVVLEIVPVVEDGAGYIIPRNPATEV